MKVRMFLFLALSLSLFNGQSLAWTGNNIAENGNLQSDDSLPRIDAKNKWSVRIADSFVNRCPAEGIYNSVFNGKWTFEQGVALEALHQIWLTTRNPKYLNYIKSNIDMFIGGDGSIRTYNYNDFKLENIYTGSQLLKLYSVTKDKKYKIAADTLMKQLKNQPRTKTGGFRHKKTDPGQMRLEDLYMGLPFYSQYSMKFRQTKNFNDIANQFILLEENTRDEKTGLLYHTWDESPREKWADSEKGGLPDFFAPAIGSYAAALVDVLDYFPKNHPERKVLVKILRGLSESLMKVRDENSRLWYQAIGQGAKKGNYYESSAACMFGYAFAKGANKGYLDKKYLGFAKETFDGVISNFTSIDEMGYIDLHKTCCTAGPEGKLQSDRGYEYYINEPLRTNDLKGIGAFIMMAIELEKARILKTEQMAYKGKYKD